MAITYTLVPLSMTVVPDQSGQQNVVVRVGWNYTGTDGVYVGINAAGFTELTYTEGNPFTPYQNLTQAQVIAWVLSAWSSEDTAARQKVVNDQIAAQQAAQYATPPLPWS